MAHENTTNLNLKKLDPNARMSLSDLRAFFETNQDTIDANIKALFDRIEAIAAAGYTPIQPVNVPDGSLTVRIENAAAAYFNLPTLLASFPEHTPVRITGFLVSITTINEVNAFFTILDTLDGLDASNHGVSRAQMNGVIDMGTTAVTGDQINAWAERYPNIRVTSTRITNTLTFKNFDGSAVLHEETVNYGADSAWTPANETDRSDHPEGYYYVFQGWSLTANATTGNDALTKNVTESRVLYAAYSRHARTGPTFEYAQKATRVTDTAIAYVDYWEDFTEATHLLYNKSDGTEVTNLSVGASGNVIMESNSNILTVHMFADLFSGFNYAILFKKGNVKSVSVPLLLIDGKPYLHVETYATAVGETAVVKIVTLGRYARVVSLAYKESGNADEYTVTSPSVIFNVDTANNKFSIKMLSSAMLNGSGYAINVEDSQGEPLRVPIPNLRTIR